MRRLRYWYWVWRYRLAAWRVERRRVREGREPTTSRCPKSAAFERVYNPPMTIADLERLRADMVADERARRAFEEDQRWIRWLGRY